MRKSLRNPEDLAEIKQRLQQLKPDTKKRWGSMNSAQMMRHCDKILQVGLGKVILPKTNFLFRTIGVIAKIEIRFFNNGIPPNMPTYNVVKIKENCNFDQSKAELLENLDEFCERLQKNMMLEYHQLFGTMTPTDWGFLQYKHINHHLNQFGL